MQIAQMIQNYQPAKPQEKSMFESVSDMFTGADRETERSQSTEELTTGNLQALAAGAKPESGLKEVLSGEVEFGQGAMQGNPITGFFKDTIRKFTSSDDEVAAIAMDQYPNLQKQADDKGNVYIVNPESGESIAVNQPGLSMTDLRNLAYTTAAFTHAGRASSVLSAIGKNAATQAAIEGGQALSGGEFNPADVAIAGATGGLAKKAEDVVGNFVRGKADQAEELMEDAITAETGRITNPIAQERQTVNIANELSKQTKAMLRPNPKSLAGDVNPDLDVIEAAERLGIDDALTPGMVSKSDAYKDIEGALRAKGANDLSRQANEAILKTAQSADDLITDFGGSLDKAGLSEELKSRTAQTIADIDDQVVKAYDEVASKISPTQKVDMSDAYVELQQQAEDLGGVKFLEPFERRILSITENNPSYALVDKERKKIGAALHKKQGAYKDMDTGRLKRMYGILTDAQGGSLTDDALNSWNVAKGLTSQRKQVEDQSIQMFGKDLSGSFMPKFGNAVKKLQSSDYKDFDNLIKAIPDREMRERVMISALNDAFTQGSRKEKSMSIPGFVDWYESIRRQPALMKRIDDNLPSGSADRLKDIFTVSKAMRDANSRVIKTGIASETLGGLDKADGMLSKLYGVVKSIPAAEGVTSSIGLPGAGTAGVITGAMMGRTKDPLAVSADKLISSSEFKRLAVQLARDNFNATRASEAAERALRQSDKYKRWLDKLPDENKRAVLKGGLISYLTTTNDEY
ncbi:MAG: hypothetical protein GY905_15975 [Gammaproteobacteria bacterium]|nr:hypothetical protein [Gammaproteobacteria bacterium]